MKSIEEIEKSFKTTKWCDATDAYIIKKVKQKDTMERLKRAKEDFKDDEEHMLKVIYTLGFMLCKDYFKKEIQNYVVECQQSFTQMGYDYCIEQIQKLQVEQENANKNIVKNGNVININFNKNNEGDVE